MIPLHLLEEVCISRDKQCQPFVSYLTTPIANRQTTQRLPTSPPFDTQRRTVLFLPSSPFPSAFVCCVRRFFLSFFYSHPLPLFPCSFLILLPLQLLFASTIYGKCHLLLWLFVISCPFFFRSALWLSPHTDCFLSFFFFCCLFSLCNPHRLYA